MLKVFVNAFRTPELRRKILFVLGIVVLLVLGASMGLASARLPDYAIFLALGVLLIAVAAIDLSLVPVLAVPAVFAVQRIGPMSGSDFLLGIAVVVSLVRRSR